MSTPARSALKARGADVRGEGARARVERLLEVRMRLEHAANVFPLFHVVCYYAIFLLLVVPGAVNALWLQSALWIALVLLNFSLSIGIQHMHAHRRLFTARVPNRVLEILLCFPCVTSYPMMKYVHVYLHHKYQDAPPDPTSTRGRERGVRAVLYWLTYSFVAQGATIKGLYAKDAAPVWRDLRAQHVVDNLAVIAIAWVLIFALPERMLWVYAVPMALVLVNIGYFAWLTHGPCPGAGPAGSLNTVNRWMNFFIHNQGYHYIHHRYPGVHWTRIPDHLDLMKEVDDRLIVPYWVTLNTAWRILLPRLFHSPDYGARWKARYDALKAEGTSRLAWLPYFSWV